MTDLLDRFEFTIILPSGLAPQNWVPHANVTHDLYAELEGIPEERSTSPFFRPLSLSSFSSGRKTPVSPSSQSSRLPSRSPSPGLDTARLDNALLTATTSMSITRQEPFSMPVAPSYDESQAVYHGKSLESTYSKDDEATRWISGFHDAHRTIAVVYNPNPAGSVTQLDERVSSFAPGVGVYEWRMVAEEVSSPHPNMNDGDDAHDIVVAHCCLASIPLHPPRPSIGCNSICIPLLPRTDRHHHLPHRPGQPSRSQNVIPLRRAWSEATERGRTS